MGSMEETQRRDFPEVFLFIRICIRSYDMVSFVDNSRILTNLLPLVPVPLVDLTLLESYQIR
jgi:hypothetical protein